MFRGPLNLTVHLWHLRSILIPIEGRRTKPKNRFEVLDHGSCNIGGSNFGNLFPPPLMRGLGLQRCHNTNYESTPQYSLRTRLEKDHRRLWTDPSTWTINEPLHCWRDRNPTLSCYHFPTVAINVKKSTTNEKKKGSTTRDWDGVPHLDFLG